MSLKILFISTFTVIAVVPGQDGVAQTDCCASSGVLLKDDLCTFAEDAAVLMGAPLNFSDEEWLITGVLLSAAAMIMTADIPARKYLEKRHNDFSGRLASFGTGYGREIYGFALAGGLYSSGLVFKKNEIRETGLLLFESIAFTTATSLALKSLFGRSRPSREEGPTRFRGLQFGDDNTSLPSGHTAVAFAISSLLAERIGNIYASIGLYSMATVTAFSRVYEDRHWVSDAFVGALIGTAYGIAVARLHEGRGSKTNVRIKPKSNGLSVEYIFN